MPTFEDVEAPEIKSLAGPDKLPLFGAKLPFGRRIAEIMTGNRRSLSDDPEQAKKEEDLTRLFEMVATELAAIHDIMNRAGLINADGYSPFEGSGGSGGGGPGTTNWRRYSYGFGGGDGLEEWMITLLQWLSNNGKRVLKLLWILMKNKPDSTAAGKNIGNIIRRHEMFERGKFNAPFVLDRDCPIALTLPGTLVAGSLPTKAWQNRQFADLENKRIYVCTSHGAWSEFFTVAPVGWQWHPADKRIYPTFDAGNEPGLDLSLFTDVTFGAAGASSMLFTDSNGVVDWLGHQASILDGVMKNTGAFGSPQWSSPIFRDDAFGISDASDTTTKIEFDAGSLTADRTINMPDRDVNLRGTFHSGGSAPSNGELLWWKPADATWYGYDNVREKWLSSNEDSGYFGTDTNGTVDAYLPLIEGVPCGGAGFASGEWMRFDGTITGAWVAVKAVT
jgi:hypothetical protein